MVVGSEQQCSGIEELPDSVGKLVHLRYLGLARTNVKELPESVEKPVQIEDFGAQILLQPFLVAKRNK